MKTLALAAVALASILAAGLAAGATPTTITERSAPLVKALELRYASSLEAARSGDLDAYWGHRTAASRERPPFLDSTRLRLLAELLPPLDTLQFVRLDANDKTARALYRWRKADVAQYTVIVYRVEHGEWRIDDFSVKRSAGGAAARATENSQAPLPAPAPAQDTMGPAPALDAPRL